AGNDMDIRVTNPSSDGRGIRIGELNENETLLAAGNEARFYVQGDGNIHFAGDVIAEKGDVIADISGTGNIEIYNSVESGNDSVSLRTGKGDIVIGADNTHNEETIKAKNNVTVETGTGTITIQGKTSTQVGDITMKAGKDSYQAGVANGNFIIRDDGKMISGGGIALNGRNGDIEITDDMQAEKSITVNIAEEGNASFGRDVTVTNDVNISTDKGSITVGQTVNADEGTVSLSTGSGNISIGKDVTAGKDVAVSSRQGNITVGHTETGDDGDILSKAGNVSIGTGAGDVQIVKTVTAEEGSIGISSGQGDILIGDNGPDVKTVTAKQDIDLTAQDGRIVVYGKTSTEEGDISLSAHRKETIPGEDNSTFVIDQNGKLEAGRSIRLDVEGGDLHVSDRIQAKEDLTTELSGKGSVYFDKDVNVNGNVTVRTDEGDIKVGHEVLAVKDINMTTNTGDVDIGSAVKSTGGSIGIHLGTGNVNIGDNGPNVDTVTAKENIDIGTYTGKIYIYGKTSTQAGDISLSAGNRQYTPGSQSIIIDLNGMVDSGRDVRLAGRNGDLHVTDAIRVKRDLYAQVFEEGGVYFDRQTAVKGDLTLAVDVIVADRITADNGGKVFRFSAAGAFPKRVIDYFRVGSLNSEGGTEMPSLWTKHGYLHVDKGDIAVDDAFAVDKIYLENDKTNVAIFGRIPTRDGEQLVYWNNLDMADSKKRSFQLYTDGTLRTHGAVLIDAEGNYGKLYGDNLSVVDMMRDRVSHERGKYTFDSALLTEPGRLMREPVFFGVESTDVIIQQQNASDAEIVVE
ncbi:MAG: hypothetical protein IJ812_02700, partial [Schwartzia sp.]|nr:hypothetical protein [Schwartzia sp. (in: firmicutes)]